MSTLLGQYGLQMRYIHVWMETTQECTSTHTYTHTCIGNYRDSPPVWVGPWCSQISLGNHQGLKGIQQSIGILLLCGWGPGVLKWVWATMFLPYTGIQRLVCSQPFFQKWAGDETIQRHPTNIGVPSVWESKQPQVDTIVSVWLYKHLREAIETPICCGQLLHLSCMVSLPSQKCNLPL